MAHVISQSLQTRSFSGSENEEINTARTASDMAGRIVIVVGEVLESDDELELILEDATDKSLLSPASPSPN